MSDFSKLILEWYDQHARELPWRMTGGTKPNPYHIWLSEIMLQQTTVATVKSYFSKFLKRWPTLQDMAASPQEEILKEWAGLGYYARARNLHKCATVLTDSYNGEFPQTEAELKNLPGVGDYTSAAIAAIAFGEPAAVVDGNIERITTRVFRIKTQLPKAKAEIKKQVTILTPGDRPGDFAQAMMDLGASHCSPKKPSCLLCPVQKLCQAQLHGDQETYPVKAPKKIKPTRKAYSFWLEHDGHVLLERREQKGLLGGMPGFFSTPWEERSSFPNKEEWLAHRPSEDYWKHHEGIAKHTFTHFHLETKLLVAKTKTKLNVENAFWHPIDQLNDIGLPTVFKKIHALMK